MEHKHMNPGRRTALGALLSAATATLMPTPANAFPDKPVKVFVGFAAGGAADVLARQLGAKLAEQLGQSFVVENRPGATGTIAAAAMAKSPPDGQTIMLCSQSTMLIAPSMYSKLPFEPDRDFVPVIQLVSMPMLLVVNPSVKANNMAELLQLLKTEKLSYASAGMGGPQHVAGEVFQHLSKTKMVHVPYNGEAPAMNDAMGGSIQVMFANLPVVMPFINSGRLRALAISSPQRHPSYPNIPALSEIPGLKEFDVQGWYGLFAPAATPAAVVKKLNEESQKALRSSDLSSKLQQQGYSLIGSSTEQFSSFMKIEGPRWAKLIKDANIKAE